MFFIYHFFRVKYKILCKSLTFDSKMNHATEHDGPADEQIKVPFSKSKRYDIQSKTSCFTLQSMVFYVAKDGVYESKTTCFTVSDS